jgi:hypothetical protein
VQRGLDASGGNNHDQQRDQENPTPPTAVDAAVAAAGTGILGRHEIRLVMAIVMGLVMGEDSSRFLLIMRCGTPTIVVARRSSRSGLDAKTAG